MGTKRIIRSYTLMMTMLWLIVFINTPALCVKAGANITLESPAHYGFTFGRATAKWDAVYDANYYKVKLIVSSDERDVLGTRITGTADTMIDLQDEIASVLDEVEYMGNGVRIACTVTAEKHLDNEVIATAKETDLSIWKIYRLNSEPLEVPRNVTLSDNGIASWELDSLIDAKRFDVSFYIKNEEEEKFTSTYVDLYEGTYENGIFQCDLTTKIENVVLALEMTGDIEVYIKVRCVLEDAYSCDQGDRSESSDIIKRNIQGRVFPQITNISFDNDLNVSLSMDEIEDFAGFSYEYIVYKGGNVVISGSYRVDSMFKDIPYKNGKYSISLKEEIESSLKNSKHTGEWESGTYVIDKFRIKPFTRTYMNDSYRTEYGEFTEYYTIGEYEYVKKENPIVGEPKIVSFSDNGMLVFTPPSAPSVENVLNLGVRLEYRDITEEESPILKLDNYYEGTEIKYKDMEYKDGNFIVDLTKLFVLNDKVASYDDDLYLRIQISVGYQLTEEGKTHYYRSEYSDFTDYVNFNWNLDRLDICPQRPVVAKGRTLMLGKAIHPLFAKYDKIEWKVENGEIASIEQNGYVTGKSIGKTEVTASIGEISTTVPLNVYEVVTNFDDNRSYEIVKNQAENIIDSIANEMDADYSGTDIDESQLDDLKGEIIDGLNNGDTFHTDITYMQNTFTTYKGNWGQIQQAVNDLNAKFAGAYNIEVEMYHKDKEDKEYPIGNITELDNEATFTFDLPTGMKELESGDTKKYVLVRVHKNSQGEEEYETIDYTINEDGTFTAKSDKFSGFVWLELASKNCADIHRVTKVDKQNATCTVYGVKEYFKCSCGKYYLDAKCTNEIADFKVWKSGAGRIAKKDHKYGTAWKSDGKYHWHACSVCGAKKDKEAHKLKTTKKKASLTAHGKKETICTVCQKVTKKDTIYAAKKISLLSSKFTYDGKKKRPVVLIRDSKGNNISRKNYTITYSDGRNKVGQYSVSIKFKENYSGKKTLKFVINPKKTVLNGLTRRSKSFVVKWAKTTKEVTGYEIQYSASSSFASGNKIIKVKSAKGDTKTVKNLKAKKKYYVRIRTYKTVGKKNYYSDWSAKKSVTTK